MAERTRKSGHHEDDDDDGKFPTGQMVTLGEFHHEIPSSVALLN